jgi:hypothetical protein
MVIEHNARPGVRQYLLVSRILFFLSIGLTVAGGVLKGSDSSSDAITEVKLVKAGYFSAVAFVACLFAVQGHFWTQFSRLSHTSQMVHQRTIYLIFSQLIVFTDSQIHYPSLAVYGRSHHLSISFCVPRL